MSVHLRPGRALTALRIRFFIFDSHPCCCVRGCCLCVCMRCRVEACPWAAPAVRPPREQLLQVHMSMLRPTAPDARINSTSSHSCMINKAKSNRFVNNTEHTQSTHIHTHTHIYTVTDTHTVTDAFLAPPGPPLSTHIHTHTHTHTHVLTIVLLSGWSSFARCWSSARPDRHVYAQSVSTHRCTACACVPGVLRRTKKNPERCRSVMHSHASSTSLSLVPLSLSLSLPLCVLCLCVLILAGPALVQELATCICQWN